MEISAREFKQNMIFTNRTVYFAWLVFYDFVKLRELNSRFAILVSVFLLVVLVLGTTCFLVSALDMVGVLNISSLLGWGDSPSIDRYGPVAHTIFEFNMKFFFFWENVTCVYEYCNFICGHSSEVNCHFFSFKHFM